jgi:hypothetical protein
VTGRSDQPQSNGDQLGHRRTLTERIAAGGLGEVWRGLAELLGRPVAIKLPSAAYAGNKQFRARFRAEEPPAHADAHRDQYLSLGSATRAARHDKYAGRVGKCET